MKGFQAEVDNTNDVGGIYETGGRGWVRRPDHERTAAIAKPGDWNTMTIRAIGPEYTVLLNGSQTVSFTDDRSRREGHIALQLHGGQDMEVLFSGAHDCGGVIKTLGPSKNMAKPAGEWNRYVITCVGSRLQVEFNGERVIDLDLATSAMKDRPLRGLIGFQDEGKPVWYRNVRIVELPAEPALP